jgi:hypothetical protein
MDEIRDWDTHDKLMFASGPGSDANYTEYAGALASDDTTALQYAHNAFMAASGLQYVAVKVGADVVLFARDGGAEDAVLLVGRTLADIDSSNIV